MSVGEIMDTSPLFVREDDYITHARQVLRDNKLRSIPVLDDEGRVEGVFTRRGALNVTSSKSNVTVKGFIKPAPVVTIDMCILDAGKKMINSTINSIPVIDSPHDKQLKGSITINSIFSALKDLDISPDGKVGDIMSENVLHVDIDENVSKCWIKMIESGYSGIPVTKKGNLIGIVTRGDMLESGFARFKREGRSGQNAAKSIPVEKIMTTPVITTYPDIPIYEATSKLIERNIGRLPVLDRKKNDMVGIVDRYDFLESYIR